MRNVLGYVGHPTHVSAYAECILRHYPTDHILTICRTPAVQEKLAQVGVSATLLNEAALEREEVDRIGYEYSLKLSNDPLFEGSNFNAEDLFIDRLRLFFAPCENILKFLQSLQLDAILVQASAEDSIWYWILENYAPISKVLVHPSLLAPEYAFALRMLDEEMLIFQNEAQRAYAGKSNSIELGFRDEVVVRNEEYRASSEELPGIFFDVKDEADLRKLLTTNQTKFRIYPANEQSVKYLEDNPHPLLERVYTFYQFVHLTQDLVVLAPPSYQTQIQFPADTIMHLVGGKQ